jgi:hypothetical protein
MDTALFWQGVIILVLAALSYTIGHGARILMLKRSWLVWLAGTSFGFVAFITSRVALAAAAWGLYSLLFGQAPEPWILVALVGLASAPLLLSFVHLTPFFGPGVLRLLYVIALFWLVSASSAHLNMDWLGSLGWWLAAWLLVSGISYGLTWLFRNAKWLAWTGILGPFRTTPEAVMGKMPGMKEARWMQD